jgi:hypothetical protein
MGYSGGRLNVRLLRSFVHRNGTRTRVFETWAENDLLGQTVSAVARHDAEQAAMARRLGYGEDVDAMTRDHDLLHALLADMLGLPCSLSLKLAAGLANADDRQLADIEEAAVLAVQEFVRAAGVDLVTLPART